jgi:hypothetical protein
VITLIVDYILDLSARNADREIAVIVPELIEHRWYHYALHDQRPGGATPIENLGEGDLDAEVANG